MFTENTCLSVFTDEQDCECACCGRSLSAIFYQYFDMYDLLCMRVASELFSFGRMTEDGVQDEAAVRVGPA